MTQDNDVKDLAAMFAMAALIMKGYSPLETAQEAQWYADEFMRVRAKEPQPTEGIVAITPQRKYARKSAD